jgi:hypothetical protein
MNLSARAPGGAAPAGFVPYVYGAALGCPSRARPEKVLARLKNTTSMQQEDGLAREVRGAVPGVQSRNGMPEAPGYVYRGTGADTLTGALSPWRLTLEAKAAVPAAPAPLPRPARRKAVRLAPMTAPPPEPAPVPVPAAVPEPAPAPARRCRKCRYLTGTIGHKLACGDGT